MVDETVDEQNAGDVDERGDDWTGLAVGGPLDGCELTSRCVGGILLVDRPAGQCWLYDWSGTVFQVRGDGAPLVLVEDLDAVDNRFRAADEDDFDVQAAPWVGGDPDDVDVDADGLEDAAGLDDADDGADAAAGVEVAGPIGEEG